MPDGVSLPPWTGSPQDSDKHSELLDPTQTFCPALGQTIWRTIVFDRSFYWVVVVDNAALMSLTSLEERGQTHRSPSCCYVAVARDAM